MVKIPYSDDELKVIGTHVSANSASPRWKAMMGDTPRYNTPITPKENMWKVINREGAVWIPTGNDVTYVESRINTDHVARAEVMDQGEPQKDEEKGGPDLFGIEWVFVPVAGGSMVKPGTPFLADANEWYDKVVFPDVDGMDWAGMAELNAPYKGQPRCVGATFQNGLFERLISFMDFEGAAMAMIDEDQQDAIKDLFEKLCGMYENFIAHYQEAIGIDTVMFHDDWGSQRSPFFSLDTCREMLVPYLKRLVDFCHDRGIWFQLHSCGCNELLVPAMIEAGVDYWNGQDMNDKAKLYELYGDKILLGMPAPVLPQDATDEEIDAAAKAFVDKYAPTFNEKPFIVAGFGISPKMTQAIYKHSRIALAK